MCEDGRHSAGHDWRAEHARLHAATPQISLPFPAFVAHLERLRIRGIEAIHHLPDLYLAFACLEGDPIALAAFDRVILRGARPAIGRIRSDDDFVDEVVQELRTKLLVGVKMGLLAYSGRGSLAAWVRVTATRTAIDAIRALGSAPHVVGVCDALTEHDLSPEAKTLRGAHCEAFQQALADALAALTAEDRNLLRRHLVDQMTLEGIAAPYGVHVSTVARRLALLRERLARSVRAQMADRYDRLSHTQIQSVFRAIRSHVYVSLSPLLLSDGFPGAIGDGG